MGRTAPASPLAVRDALGISLTPAAALAVHELRYRLAFGSGAGPRLHDTGHAYLGAALPLVGLLAALFAGRWLMRLARRYGSMDGTRRRPVAIWMWATIVLLGLYAGQELAEGALAAGHASGLNGVFGDGGFWAVPSAAFVGALLTLLLRGASAAERAVAAARVGLTASLGSSPSTVWLAPQVRVASARRGRRTRSRAPPAAFI